MKKRKIVEWKVVEPGCSCWYVDTLKRYRRTKHREIVFDKIVDAICISTIVGVLLLITPYLISFFV